MKAAAVFVAVALALALQTTLAYSLMRDTAAVDLVLVVVTYVALRSGPVVGLLAGAFGGLVQDALSVGVNAVIGIGGLAKTVVGFVAGIVGRQFIVAQPLPRFIVFLAATLVHAVIFMGLYVALDLREFDRPYASIASQGALNGLIGVVAFQVADMLPGVVERRKAGGQGMRLSRWSRE